MTAISERTLLPLSPYTNSPWSRVADHIKTAFRTNRRSNAVKIHSATSPLMNPPCLNATFIRLTHEHSCGLLLDVKQCVSFRPKTLSRARDYNGRLSVDACGRAVTSAATERRQRWFNQPLFDRQTTVRPVSIPSCGFAWAYYADRTGPKPVAGGMGQRPCRLAHPARQRPCGADCLARMTTLRRFRAPLSTRHRTRPEGLRGAAGRTGGTPL